MIKKIDELDLCVKPINELKQRLGTFSNQVDLINIIMQNVNSLLSGCFLHFDLESEMKTLVENQNTEMVSIKRIFETVRRTAGEICEIRWGILKKLPAKMGNELN